MLDTEEKKSPQIQNIASSVDICRPEQTKLTTMLSREGLTEEQGSTLAQIESHRTKGDTTLRPSCTLRGLDRNKMYTQGCRTAIADQ